MCYSVIQESKFCIIRFLKKSDLWEKIAQMSSKVQNKQVKFTSACVKS